MNGYGSQCSIQATMFSVIHSARTTDCVMMKPQEPIVAATVSATRWPAVRCAACAECQFLRVVVMGAASCRISLILSEDNATIRACVSKNKVPLRAHRMLGEHWVECPLLAHSGHAEKRNRCRYWGQSGHGILQCKCPLLTQSGQARSCRRQFASRRPV